MGEVPKVSKEMEIPLHSPRGLVYIFCMSSSKAATHEIDGFRFNILLVNSLSRFLLGIVVCHGSLGA